MASGEGGSAVFKRVTSYPLVFGQGKLDLIGYFLKIKRSGYEVV